jgi:type IV pilus assembly protein PilW
MNMRSLQSSPRRVERGFSLIELMVALTVGMVLTLAVFGVLATSEGRKRVTTNLNDLEQAGNLALYQLDQWVRSSGSGFSGTAVVDKSAYGCLLRARNSDGQTLPGNAALPAPFDTVNPDGERNFPLLPVMILPDATTPGTSGTKSDALMIMAGSSSVGGAGLSMTADPSSNTLSIGTTLAFTADDLLLMVDPSMGSTCLVTQVSAKDATTLTLGGEFYAATVDDTTVSGSFKHDSGVLLPLGSVSNAPQFVLVGVGNNNTLYSFDLLQMGGSGAALQARADNVFEMHALYGVDKDADGKIDHWVTAGSTSDYAVSKLMAGTKDAQTLMKRIKAIRVGLILRTTLPEKSSADTSTGTTVTPLFSSLGDEALTYTRKLSEDERMYRYRTMEATLVLRNNLVMKD